MAQLIFKAPYYKPTAGNKSRGGLAKYIATREGVELLNRSGMAGYIEIFDVRGSSEKRILKAYAKVIDSSSIELIQPEGDIFYETPTTPVVIHKTI